MITMTGELWGVYEYPGAEGDLEGIYGFTITSQVTFRVSTITPRDELWGFMITLTGELWGAYDYPWRRAMVVWGVYGYPEDRLWVCMIMLRDEPWGINGYPEGTNYVVWLLGNPDNSHNESIEDVSKMQKKTLEWNSNFLVQM